MRGIVLTREMARNTSGRKTEKFSQDDTEMGSHGRSPVSYTHLDVYKRQGLVDGELIVNPSQAQWDKGDLQLTVASTREKVIMIEAGANEVKEEVMIDAIYKCHAINLEIIKFIDQIVAEVGKPKHSYESCAVPEELFAKMKEIVTPEEMEAAVFTDVKQVREENIRQVTCLLYTSRCV